MSLTIRPATLADASTIVEFNRRLAWESEGKALDCDVLAQGVQALLHDKNKGFYTVADIDGEVIGQTLITLEWSDWRNGWFWWIQSVYVREDHRSRGVFTAIVDDLKHQAGADVIGLRLYVEVDNVRAQRVYAKLGLEMTTYGMMEMHPLR